MTSQGKTGFDASLTGTAENGMFGIAAEMENATLVYIPVPWEVTTSYGGGTAKGPESILRASPQLDLYLQGVDNHYLKGFYLMEEMAEIRSLNEKYRPIARVIQDTLEKKGTLNDRPELASHRGEINDASRRLNDIIYRQVQQLDRQGKCIGLIGGDHSTPMGLIQYLAEKYNGDLGILHIDAHHDLRQSYQGFVYSHASIMKNVMDLNSAPKSLVQVGIRDYCEQEARLADGHAAIHPFYDHEIKAQLFEGKHYRQIVDDIIEFLPDRVYVSFDIDGLQPDLCPNTGTPVPGGLSLEQASYLIKSVVRAGKTIVGFDLCEVAPDKLRPDNEWDGNVGARVLFMLSTWMLESRQS